MSELSWYRFFFLICYYRAMTDKPQTSINRAFFRAMALLSAAFITMHFITSSVIFYGRIFRIEQESAIRQLSYISDQLSYYLRSVDNDSKTIMIDTSIQSTRFIHSVSLYTPDKKRIATTAISPLSGRSDASRIHSRGDLAAQEKIFQHEKQKVLYSHSLVRPFYDYSTGTLLGYVEFFIPDRTISDTARNVKKQFGLSPKSLPFKPGASGSRMTVHTHRQGFRPAS